MRWQPPSLDFRLDGEGPLHPTAVTKRFNRLVAASGLPRIRLHDLRHTHATLALSAGIHPKIVCERLGHSSVAFTLDVYSHSNPHLQEAAAESISNLVFRSTG
ncbi:MAG: site-specific integrase [Actinomycetota bacterium]